MAQKIWRGDSPAVAQVTRLTISAVEIGDVFSVTCGGKTISVTATVATVASVVALLVAAINDSRIPEFGEFTAAVDGSTILLTANTAGVPFVVTASASNGGTGGVDVTTTTQGAAASGAVSAVVSFAVPISGMSAQGVASGTFKIFHLSHASSAIAVGASAATVQTAIQAISSVGAGNATVTKSSVSPDGIHYDGEIDTYTVTFASALANSDQTLEVVCSSLRPVSRRIQRESSTLKSIFDIDFGTPVPGSSSLTYTLSWRTLTSATLALDAFTSVIETEIRSSLSAGLDVWQVAYQSSNVLRLEARVLTGDDYFYANNVAGTAVTFSAPVTIVTAGHGVIGATNEVQVITLSNAPTGGTFTLTLGANTTSGLAWNASAATVQTALQGLASIGASNATVTGSDGGPWTVTFVVGKAATNMSQLSGNGASLTGGVFQTIANTSVVASAGPNHYDDPNNWSPVGVPITGDTVRFDVLGADCLYGLAQSGVTLAALYVSMSWLNRKLGLPTKNQSGYNEYREQQLTCGMTSIVIGGGGGSGPSRVYLDCGAIQTALIVKNSGGSADALPAVIWLGTHVSNTVEIWNGDVGFAPFDDLSAAVYSLKMYGGSLSAHNTAFGDSFAANGERVRAFNCTLGGKILEL